MVVRHGSDERETGTRRDAALLDIGKLLLVDEVKRGIHQARESCET